MKMGVLYSFFAVIALILLVCLGVGVVDMRLLFGAVIPYAALAIFVLGIVYRVLKWASSPVPFRIPTTCGQQKSHPWIKSSYFDNPHNMIGVIGRMALELLLFRSLFRNTKADIKDQRILYSGDKYLWAAGLAFHWSFLVILLRHFRFFTEPIMPFVPLLQKIDGFFDFGVPTLYLTDVGILAAVTYLFARRVVIPQVRYISLPADYFPLFLILGIAASGVLMRHFFRVDLLGVKELTIGLINLDPKIPDGIGLPFFIHLFLVCSLIAYFPFSKMMHVAGIFLSPTRNLANNNRIKRHVNPWNPQVKTHSYEEWEDEFRDLMRDAGMPLEKE